MSEITNDTTATAHTDASINSTVQEDNTMIETTNTATATEEETANTIDTAATAAIVSEVTSNPLATPAAVEPGGPTNDQIIAYFNKHDKLVVKFVAGVTALLQNLDFLVDEDWIEHAIKGLEKTDNADRLGAQLTTTVTKDLRSKAIDHAEETGQAIKLPTKDQIDKAVAAKLLDRRNAVQLAKDKRLATARRAVIAQ